MLNHDELNSRNRNIIFILSVIAIAYLPIWSFVFSLKNDFYTQYFLQRFFIGESITAHQFPLWNPYFNYGLPVYNDMNGGFWYPLTWINGLLTGYNAYSFAIEEVIHFPIAAAGMYLLARHLQLGLAAKIMAAISYACCGYFVAHTQHYNWITGAAWLPWCLLAIYRCTDKPSLINFCLGGLTFSLFISGAHPGLIIGGIYFFAIMWAIYMNEKGNFLSAGKNLIGLISVVTLCMAGLIYSYSEIIPLFTRSGKISAGIITNFSTPPGSFFSFFLPLPYTQIRGEEITMNNLYAGLLMIVSVIAGITRNRKRTDLFYIAAAVFFFLISTNLPVSVFIITKLPLLQYVRLNGEMRIFGMIALMVYGAIQFDYLIRYHKIFLRNFALALSACLFMVCAFTLLTQPESARLISRLPAQLLQSGNREALKESIHAIGFTEAVAMQSALQCILLLLLAVAIEKKQQWLRWIVAADMILATLLNMPFTGVSMRPVAEIQALLDKAPKGFPAPYTGPEKDIYLSYPGTDTLIGNWSFYGKQIAIDEWAHYPMILQITKKYFDAAHQSLKQQDKPFVFTNGGRQVILEKYSPDNFTFLVETENNDRLIIKQNLYPGWETTVNKELFSPDTAFYTFPSIHLQKGTNHVTYSFNKPVLNVLFILYWACLITMASLLITGTFYQKRNR